MSSGLYSGVSGLALGTGLYKGVSGLWSGSSGLIDGFGGGGFTLSLNFTNDVYEAAASSYTFQQLIDFTRTSSGTFIGSDGLIQTTPASRNLLLFTQQFDNAAWVKTNSTVAANSVVAPDGTMTADTLTAVSANGTMLQTYIAINAPYIYSVWLRRLTGTGNVQITVDGATYATVAVTTTWTRFDTTLVPPVNTRTAGVRIVTSGDEVYAWGAQLEIIPDANLTLGSEIRSSGVTGLIGTATAATYNTGTGAGSAARVDLGNQSFVQWTGLSGVYRVNLAATTGSPTIRTGSGGPAGNIVLSVTTGTTQTVYAQATDGFITLASVNLVTPTDPSTATFTVNSFQQITGISGMPTAYTRNVGGVFQPRFDYDAATLAPRGILIEEQRTNLLLQSETFNNASWTKNNGATVPVTTGVAPDGTASADTIQAASTTSYVSQVATFTGNGSKAFSVFLKAGTATVTRLVLRDVTPTATNRGGVNITWTAGVPSGVATDGGTLQGIDAYPNGWYRVRMLAVGVVAANSNEFRFSPDTSAGTGTTIFWGAQTENGEFTTSYIPTVASQVTRTADQASIVGPMFLLWFNTLAGTFVSSFDVIGVNTATVRRHVWNGSDAGNQRLSLRALDTATNAPIAAIGTGTAVASLNGTALSVNTPTDIAVAYGSNMALSQNGATPATDASAASVSISSLDIGCNLAATLFLNGHIRSIDYYPVRLSDNQLQALTV